MRTLALAFLAAADVRAVHTTADGALWLGTGDDGVIRLRGDAEDRWFDGPAVVLFADGDAVWSASEGGLHRWYEGAWTPLGLADALGDAEVFSAARAPDGRVVLATSDGVFSLQTPSAAIVR